MRGITRVDQKRCAIADGAKCTAGFIALKTAGFCRFPGSQICGLSAKSDIMELYWSFVFTTEILIMDIGNADQIAG